MSETINEIFGPIFRGIFGPTNRLLSAIPESVEPGVAKACAAALFIAAMVWVWVGLKKQYVNLDAPSSKPWHDLRFWTVISMAPHVIVYLYF